MAGVGRRAVDRGAALRAQRPLVVRQGRWPPLWTSLRRRGPV